MKTNELRIGNLIKDDCGVTQEVECVLKTSVTYREPNSKTPFSNCHISDLSPIPLTEEWLVKLGFVNVGGSDYARNITEKNRGSDKAMIYVDSGEDNETYEITILMLMGGGDWIRTKNKYVHQLQNLYFALTGEELELK